MAGLLACLIPASVAANLPLDRIVAVVNEDVIMESELESKLRTVRNQIVKQGAPLPPASVFRRQVLDGLIQNRIQLQLAERAGIRVDDESLNRTIANIASENNVTLSEFREILEADGYSYENFREDIRNEIRLSQLRKRQVDNLINVSEKEIDNFLANQEFQGDVDSELRIAHILLALPDNATDEEIAEVRKMAEDIRQEVMAGGDFAEIAKAVSDGQNADNGGDLGWRKMDDIPSLFAEYIPNMKKGDVSEPIASSSGFHIIQVADTKDEQQTIVTQTRARHILVKVDELTTEEQAESKIQQLRERITRGDDFAVLAKGNSDDTVSALNGGELGWTTPGQLVPEFQRAMDAMQPGEISQPFQTSYGWHIVQVLERREFDNTESAKRSKARAAIYKRKLDEAMQSWARELRDEAYVEYRLDEYE
ncbi:MAG: peptidylprolyl isomerase [Gammaproteobacteria bacterium]